ncbi:MAG: hypothetical protein IPH09_11070 [bacterium]|nr:hypothetical protein [bacterium]
MIERIARADLLCVEAEVLWSEPPSGGPSVVERIKAVNPDCKVIGYVSVQMVRLDWADAPVGTYARTRWDALRRFWSYTTTRDTLQSWPKKVNVNILEPACRDAIVTIIAEFQEHSGTAFDGVLWDYFNNGIWIPNSVDVTGDPDLDGDGIPMMSDPDELAAYKAACVDMVVSLRERLGEGFIQIFNGQRAYTDSTFAALSDGIDYELFPTLGFQPPDKMRKAMDPGVYNSLWNARRWPRTVNGGPYLLLENINRAHYYDDNYVLTPLNPGDAFRAVSLLIDGCYPVWDDFVDHLFGWPDVVHSLGAPLGPTLIQGDVFTRGSRTGTSAWTWAAGLAQPVRLPDPIGNVVRAGAGPFKRLMRCGRACRCRRDRGRAPATGAPGFRLPAPSGAEARHPGHGGIWSGGHPRAGRGHLRARPS